MGARPPPSYGCRMTTHTHTTHIADERVRTAVTRIATVGACLLAVAAAWLVLVLVLLQSFTYPNIPFTA